MLLMRGVHEMMADQECPVCGAKADDECDCIFTEPYTDDRGDPGDDD